MAQDKTRSEFWKTKIKGNVKNDKKVRQILLDLGWRICVVWECSIKGSKQKDIADVAATIADWLNGDKTLMEISG